VGERRTSRCREHGPPVRRPGHRRVLTSPSVRSGRGSGLRHPLSVRIPSPRQRLGRDRIGGRR
jgi:hypothetical protein